MKIQNFAVIFIVIILPIALILSVYTGNLIDVANKQSSYDAMLLNATYDAIRAYQMNTLSNSYESETNSKVRDINASINSFFNSLASGFSSSNLSKDELTDYIPAIVYSLYDGYYIYGTYDNVVNFANDEQVQYNETTNVNKQQHGIKPYIYYSCEYQGKSIDNRNYDLVINYTLDNYITVTGTYDITPGESINIASSGYYINFNKVKYDDKGIDDFTHKTVTLYKGESNELEIKPELLGEYVTSIDLRQKSASSADSEYRLVDSDGPNDNITGKPKYYNYIIYNNVKYYLDTDNVMIDPSTNQLTGKPAQYEGNTNISHNMTYDSIPIFFLDRDTRTYINRNTFEELKSFIGTENDCDMYSTAEIPGVIGGGFFRDPNAYYYYYKSATFSNFVYDALSLIDLGTDVQYDEVAGKNIPVIASNITCNSPVIDGTNLYDNKFVNNDGSVTEKLVTNRNVIKTESYHTKYVTENGVETHVKTTYDTSKVFSFDDGNDPELASSSFSHHRLDVIISSIESSLVSAIENFRNYTGGNYEYTMPVLSEEEWDRICNNMTVVTFMQGISIGNYKYYSSYAVVANTKVKDFISKESIYVQYKDVDLANSSSYHNPRCDEFNELINTDNNEIVGYRNIDYDRKTCTMIRISSDIGGDREEKESGKYMYYPQSGVGAYECVVGRNNNVILTDELFLGNGGLPDDNPRKGLINENIRRAYIIALAREKGNSYKTYGFLNKQLEDKSPEAPGEALYTVHYLYQDYYDRDLYTEIGEPLKAIAKIGTNIETLNLNKNPSYGYKFDKIEVLNPDKGDGGEWEDLNDSNKYLKGTSNEINVKFIVDDSIQKRLSCTIEYYGWNGGLARYVLDGTRVVTHDKWVNLDNTFKISVPQVSPFNGNAVLVYTDPEGYQVEKDIIDGGLIKAYYTTSPQFTNKTFTVRYNSNGGTGTMADSIFTFFQSNVLRLNTFTREGFQFMGWALSPTGDVRYRDTESIVYSDSSEMTAANNTYYLDLYAVWESINYQIEYIPNGATSGQMERSTHYYGVKSKLSKNQYEKKYNITLDLGVGSSNFYDKGTFSVWGNGATVSFDEESKIFHMKVNRNAPKYSGLYYTGREAVIKSGKTATISFEVYSNQQVTLAFKIQNSIVGQPYSDQRKDGNATGEPQYATIQPGRWQRVYFTYKNYSANSIYDYSILSVDNNQSADMLVDIRDPKFEVTNAKTVQEGNLETLQWENKFLNWSWNGRTFADEEEILNLTDKPGAIINMEAQWDDNKIELPELHADGYTFLGWRDPRGDDIPDPYKPFEDTVIEAVWEDQEPPKVEIVVVSTTTSTITTVTTVTDEGSGMIDNPQYMYYIKEKGQPDSAYKYAGLGWGPDYVFRGLKQKTTYDIKVEVFSDKAGNTGTDTTVGTTKELTGHIFVKSQTWIQNTNREGTQTIVFGANNLSSDDIYIESQKPNSNEWDDTNTVERVEHGQTCYARLTDGTNYLDTISAKAWDDIKPKIEALDTTEGEIKDTTLTLTITSEDLESGLGAKPVYTYSYKKKSEANYKEWKKTTEEKVTFTGLIQDTDYNFKINVSDRAGNVGELILNIRTSYKYIVHYEGNGATSGSMQDTVEMKDVWFKIATNKFERRGYHFTGQFQLQSTGRKYNVGEWVVNLSPDPSTAVLLAQWIDDIKPEVMKIDQDPKLPTYVTGEVRS